MLLRRWESDLFPAAKNFSENEADIKEQEKSIAWLHLMCQIVEVRDYACPEQYYTFYKEATLPAQKSTLMQNRAETASCVQDIIMVPFLSLTIIIAHDNF